MTEKIYLISWTSDHMLRVSMRARGTQSEVQAIATNYPNALFCELGTFTITFPQAMDVAACHAALERCLADLTTGASASIFMRWEKGSPISVQVDHPTGPAFVKLKTDIGKTYTVT